MPNGPLNDIQLDRSSTVPLAQQIQEQIRSMIESGAIENDNKLLSTRVLSKQLGVNRATVATAYRKLESLGLARSGVGSGTYAIQPQTLQSSKLDQSNYQLRFSNGTRSLARYQADLPEFTVPESGAIHLAALVPDENLFPVKHFRECLNHVLDEDGGRALQYSGTLGYPPLREFISDRMSRLGSAVAPNQILIVSGAQQGCDLVFRSFLDAGDRAVVGAPTYHNIYPLLRQMEVGVVSVPVTKSGMDPDALESAVRDTGVRLIYTMPNFQNPTGVTATLENRRRILEIAAAADLPVLEDDYESDLGTDEEVLPSIQSFDRQGRVCYLGTFSKSLFPGLRVGWIAAEAGVLETITALKKAADLENSTLLQKALHEFCSRGHYDRHLARVREAIRERMQCALAALEKYMPADTAWSEPRGGYGIWVTLPSGMRSERIYTRAGERGVLVSPGTLFTGGAEDPGAIRLSISRAVPADIEKGIRILGEVVAEELQAPRPGRSVLSETPQHL